MKRVFSFLCAVLICAVLVLPAAALVPFSTPTAAYRSSVFYERLSALPATGDAALDTVAAAMSQLGYHEGDGTAEVHGRNGSGKGNYTEFNMAYGKVSGTYSYAWCAAFVSWCLEVSGSHNAAGGVFASCSLWVERLKSLGQYRSRTTGYTPQTGDLIFFHSSGVSRVSNHVGLVRYVKSGRVYTVEGNSSNAVSLHDYALGDSYIAGYGLPDYGGERLIGDLSEPNGASPGWYTVTNATLNLRAGAGTAYKNLGQVARGALFRVTEIKNGWGKAVYGGKTVWFSLKYAEFTAPFAYTVRYETDGGSAVAAGEYFSVETAITPKTVPEKEGFRFLHWAAGGATYLPGAALPVGDITLTAVYEQLPPPPEPEAPDEEEPNAPDQGSDAPGDGTQSGSTPGLDEGGAGGTPETGEAADLPGGDFSGDIAENPAATAAAAVVSGVLTAAIAAWYFCRKIL